jgi:transposase
MVNDTRVAQRPRRRRTDELKRRIVEETLVAGASVSVVARRHDVNANQVFAWRQQYQRGELGGGAALVPVGIIGKDGIVSAMTDVRTSTMAQSPDLCTEQHPTTITPKQPKMIEVELRGGTKIRIDADVKGSALQQVLKLIRSLA